MKHYLEIDGEHAIGVGCHGEPHEGVNAQELHLHVIGHEWFPLTIHQPLHLDLVLLQE